VRTFRLSKSRIAAGLQCGKRLWLTVHRPDLQTVTPDAQRRFAAGHDVGDVARGLYPGGALIDAPLSQAVRDTEAALAAPGDLTLYEATFRHRGVLVRADILQRSGRRHRMVEVKSTTRLKEHHLADVAIQAWVVEGAGLPLDVMGVAVIDTDFVYPGGGDYRGLLREIPVADQVRPLMAQVPGWVRQLNELLGGPLPAIASGAHCRRPFECPFADFCQGRLGAQATLLDEPVERPSDATPCVSPPDPSLADIDPAATDFLAELPYPRYYLDFETVQFAVPRWPGTRPYQQLVFQWSLHVERRPGELEHHEFLDTSGGSPVRPAAEALLAACGEQGPVFVYHDFEKWRLVEMALMLPDLAPRLEALTGRLVDLLRLTREHYDHPALNGSYSLKTVLPTVDPELRHGMLDDVQDGLSAQGAYHECADPACEPDRRDTVRRALLDYCSLDTLGLVRVAHRLAGR
jgi:hypothetical protein